MSAMAQGGKFTVQGTFNGQGEEVTLRIVDWEDNLLAEETRAVTVLLHEITFDLKDAAILIVEDGREEKGYVRHQMVPAIPGDTVFFCVEGTPEFRLAGSQFYLDYDDAVQAVEPKLIERFEYDERMRGQGESLSYEDAELLMNRYAEVYNEGEYAILDYVKAHPDDEASAALLAMFADYKDIERREALLTERVRNSVVANLYKAKHAAVLKMIGAYSTDRERSTSKL